MKFDGLNHKASEQAVHYLAWIAMLDEDELDAEVERFSTTVDPKDLTYQAEVHAAETDVKFLRDHAVFYLDQDEAGRMVEQDRYEAISCGSDQTYVLAKTMRSMERNFTHWTVNMQRMANDQLEATETIADAMPYIYRGIDDLTEAIRDK